MSDNRRDPITGEWDDPLGDWASEPLAQPIAADKATSDPPSGCEDDARGDPLAGSDEAEPYAVGYCKPPKKHQFQKGQSGNKKGRPKGSKNEATILKSVLIDRKVEVRDRGRARKVPVMEGLILRQAEDGLKGNTKSAGFLLNRYGQKVTGEAPVAETNDDGQEIIEAYLKRRQKRDSGEDK
jgi:hypothetical protein